ncbi:winged helix-turn-helix transcriptional regulator [Roseibium sp.]|uniref:winged helix-turn-helix transcriptional regulator n=1 Tax=Roseibium sp. TaxID=1936156 RepID=UPI003B519E9B
MADPHDPMFCPTETALGIIGGKWKGMILWCICRKIMRFNELHRMVPDISQRMLTKQLRELEEHGIIVRKVYAQVPPKVEYSLSSHGERLKPILDQLEDWSRDYLTERLDQPDS